MYTRMGEEPWLRGPLAGVHPLVAPTLHAFAQAREDLALWTDGLTDAEIWLRPYGLAPVGFQLRHIAGSVERLTTYLRGEQLTPEQLIAIPREMDPGPGRLKLLAEVNEALQQCEQVIRSLDPAILTDPRRVGRKAIANHGHWISGSLSRAHATPCRRADRDNQACPKYADWAY